MTTRMATDAFGRPIGGTSTPTRETSTIDTSTFLQKSGGTMTGDLDMGTSRLKTEAIASTTKTDISVDGVSYLTLESHAISANNKTIENINALNNITLIKYTDV